MRRERQGGCGPQDNGREVRDTGRSSADSVREVAARPAQVQGMLSAEYKAKAGAGCRKEEVCGAVRTAEYPAVQAADGTPSSEDRAKAGAGYRKEKVCGAVRTADSGRTVQQVPTDRPEVERVGMIGKLPSRCGRGRNAPGRGWRTVLGIDLTPRRRYRSYIARLERVLRLRNEEDNYLRDRLDRACSRIDHLRAHIRGLEQTNDLLNDEVMRMQAARFRHRGADGRFVRRQPEPASPRTDEREHPAR